MTIAEKIKRHQEEEKIIREEARAFIGDASNPLEERWKMLLLCKNIAKEELACHVSERDINLMEYPFHLEWGDTISVSIIIQRLIDTRDKEDWFNKSQEDFEYFTLEEENELKEYFCANFIGIIKYGK